jgi:hypothetical protein
MYLVNCSALFQRESLAIEWQLEGFLAYLFLQFLLAQNVLPRVLSNIKYTACADLHFDSGLLTYSRSIYLIGLQNLLLLLHQEEILEGYPHLLISGFCELSKHLPLLLDLA